MDLSERSPATRAPCTVSGGNDTNSCWYHKLVQKRLRGTKGESVLLLSGLKKEEREREFK